MRLILRISKITNMAMRIASEKSEHWKKRVLVELYDANDAMSTNEMWTKARIVNGFTFGRAAKKRSS